MKQNTKVILLTVGAFIGSAEIQLKNPKAYLVAGGLGLGAAIGSKNLVEGITAGAFAMLGVIGYHAMDNMEDVIDQAIDEGIL